MLIYILLVLVLGAILSVSYLLEDKVSKYTLVGFSFVILWVFASLRFGVGTDYLGYWNYYFPEDAVNDGFEPFYVGFYHLLHFLNLSPFYFFATMSLGTLAFFYASAVKYSGKPEIIILLFILTGLYTNSLNVVRHFMALGVFLYFGYSALMERSFWKYLLACVLASFFHVSALFMIPVYFMVSVYIPRLVMVGFILLALLFNLGLLGAGMMNIPGLPEKYAGYLSFMDAYISQNEEPVYLKFVNNADKFIILILLVNYRARLLAISPNYNFLINFYFIFCTFAIATRGLEEMQRLGYYFSIFSPFAIALLIEIPQNRFVRLAVPVAIVGVYFFYFIFIILSKNYGDIIPYQTFFSR